MRQGRGPSAPGSSCCSPTRWATRRRWNRRSTSPLLASKAEAVRWSKGFAALPRTARRPESARPTYMEENAMPIVQKFHHVAFRCKDAKETADFYKRVLDMDLLGAIAEDKVPSTKAP